MKLKTIGFLTITALFLSLTAQAADSYKLEYKPAQGAKFDYSAQAERKIESDMFSSTTTISSDLGVEVTSSSDESSSLLIVPANFKAKGSSMMGDWNSEEDKSYSLNGKKLRGKVLRNGKNESEPYSPPSFQDPNNMDPMAAMKAQMLTQLAADLQALSIPFPEKEVSVGETWDSEYMPIGAEQSPMSQAMMLKSTLEAVEVVNGIRCGKIGLKYSLEVKDMEPQGGPMPMKIKKLVVDGTGTGWVSLEDGHLVKSDLSLVTDLEMDSEMMGEMSMKSIQTRKLNQKV